ncbi:MBL fold metallo-hydrolase [Pollutibacter soli]|uniref:MBL fold metallo-hydrolase n=1 Tax=Pollutibacter soli TaxID=3034157 RepID=UPI003013AD86
MVTLLTFYIMQVIPLSEGSFTIDGSKQFIPFDTDADNLKERNRGSLLVEIQSFVVRTSKDLLLLDTGLGFHDQHGVLQIHQLMHAAGIDPLEITKVLLTHLHKDHAGGAGILNNATGKFQPSFPNATYYIHEKELSFALNKGLPSFIPDELEFLENNDQVVLLGDQGTIDGYIEYQISSGHSPFHQVFWIRDGDETIFFGGDEAPQLHQMKNRFVAKYDHDGKRAMELRQKWWEQGKQEGWTFLFYHDLKSPSYTASQANEMAS